MRGNGAQPTVKDVAAHAGVAVGTVHRALHGGYVSKEARQRVHDTVEALGYRPNAVAQSLRRRRSQLLGHIVHGIYPNPFFACVAAGVEDRARALGLATVTCNTQATAAVEADYVELLLRQRAAGVVFTVPVSEENVRRAQDGGLAVCVVERPKQLTGVDVVLADNVVGARAAVEHLLVLGHRAVAYIGGRPQENVERERYDGYCQALDAYGIPQREALVRFAGLSRDQGYRGMAELLALQERPTAAFVASDLAAMGALQALWQHGLRVPDDLSLVGFDDTLAAAASPPLTTVALPMWQMGTAAVDLVARRLAGAGGVIEPETVVVTTRLVHRASCASVPVAAVTTGAPTAAAVPSLAVSWNEIALRR